MEVRSREPEAVRRGHTIGVSVARRIGLRIARGALALGLGAAISQAHGAADAADLETLVMPGPVIEGHADVESECGRCHQPFRAAAQRALCLECHEQVAADARAARGFHGRSPAAARSDCRECHSEHRGRDFDAVALDEPTFDHALTDFELRGAHRPLTCAACHPAEKSHREASSRCADCHGSDDPHRGRLGEDCGDCHREAAWTSAEFDHAATGFPLTGAHERVECALCHPDERYEKTPEDCVSCHRVTDAHRGRFGTRCGTCHGTDAFDRIRFDHTRDTRFALAGLHRQVRCEACHPGVLYQEDLATDCHSCHRLDDEHQGRNGTRCQDCHRSTGWSSTTFDHGRDTKFALQGAHAELGCDACHRSAAREAPLDPGCFACHEADDVHEGQQGRDCAHCHDETAWEDEVFFDHGLTRFPLLGLHATVSCEECHTSAAFKNASRSCAACHRRADAHQGRLGTACSTCHTPNGWRRWHFDHSTQTAFALHGAHAERNCHDCHTQATEGPVRASASCSACHGRDDPHLGSFGRDCGRCHGETSWRDVDPGR